MNAHPTDAASALQSAVAQSRSKTPGTLTVALATDVVSLATCLVALNARESLGIVARRGLCDALNIEAVLSGQRQPIVAVSRGLDADLVWCREQHVTTQTAIDLAIVERSHTDSIARVGQLVRLLGGYDIDDDTWQPAVDAAVADQIVELLTVRSGGSVLVGEYRHQPLLRLWPGCTIVQIGPSAAAPSDAAKASTDHSARAPAVEDVADHARFLVGHDLQTLRSMHAGLDAARYADVYAVWLANLDVLATHAQHRDVAHRAATVLRTLSGR
jgi:hypothetical protein